MLYACGSGRGRRDFISYGNLRATVNEKELVDTFEHRPQGLRRAEIAHNYVHGISEPRSCLVYVAHEYPRSLTPPD